MKQKKLDLQNKSRGFIKTGDVAALVGSHMNGLQKNKQKQCPLATKQ